MRSKLTHALGTGAEFAFALWQTMKRRRLATITVLVCVLFVLGGEPRKAAALVRKYQAVLWDKTTAGRLYDYFTAGAGTPPQEPSTNRKRGGRNKLVVQPLPPGGFPNAKAIPTGGGDTQATATCIGALPYTDSGTTVGATNDYDLPADTTNPTMTGSCATIFAGAGPAGSLPHGAVYTGTGTAPDVVYAMSFPTGNTDTLTITMDPTGAQDLSLIVYCNNVSSNPADAIVVDDTGVGGTAEQVTIGNIAAGTTLYVVVDGYSTGATPPGPSGPYTLSITSSGAIQPSGSCSGGGTSSDLAITKTDGVTTVSPGGSTTYTITASNAGPDPVTGGTVADTFPPALTCNWTCIGAGGGTCTAAGSGNISDSVNLPAGASVTYTASCSISPSATGMLSNTAMVSGGTDPNPANNSATDTDTLTAIADLAITKTNGTSSVVASNTTTYAITASNAGPSNAPSVMVTDTFPPTLTGATWTCVGAGGGTCTAAGSGNINETVNLPAGGSVTFLATVTVSGGVPGTVSNTATVMPLGGVMDLAPGNNSATDTDNVTCPVVTLAPASLPTGEVGTAYNQTIVASPAGGSYSYTVTNGQLPPGLTLNAATGAISGTPSQTGNFNFRVTATGFGSCTAFLDYLIAVTTCAPITVSPASLPGGTVGTAYSETVSATPAGAYAFTVTNGVLPPGLSLNAATGVISGTPTNVGGFNFRVTAALEGCSGSRDYAMTIACPAITITTASPLPPAQAGVAYSQTINVSPAGSYTFSVLAGTLPAGLTLNPATGVISGIATSTGTATFTVKAQEVSGCNATQSYTLVIGCPTVTVNPATLPSGSTGTAYSQPLSASPAGGNYSYAATGSVPPGLNLNPATGVLSGTPTANGSFPFTVTATGFGGCPGSQSYTVVIGSGGCPTVTLPASLPGGSVGALYNNAVAAAPSGLYSYGVTAGSLPPGVTLFGSNGLIFGYPTAAGTYSFTITATQGACSGSQAYTVTIGAGFASSLTVFSDFDGDGKSDLSVFRGSDGNWLVANSGDGQVNSTPWGASYEPYNDVPVSGDYDGDGSTDLAVFRRGGEYAGYWFVKRSSDGGVSSHFWGLPTDIPVPGDYDGDGKTDVAVWRGSVGGWYIVRSSDGGVDSFHWGVAAAGDIPVPGDYDGDLKTDFAVFRRSGVNSRGDGHWYVRQSSDGSTMNVEWGVGTDVPVPGDYDADGKTDLAVWRASDGNWYIIESSSGAQRTVALGAKGDVQAPGDYDGDGKADATVWRGSTGTWLIKRSSDGSEVSTVLGQTGDVPVAAKKN